jgi:hypothetical protein
MGRGITVAETTKEKMEEVSEFIVSKKQDGSGMDGWLVGWLVGWMDGCLLTPMTRVS